MTNDAQQHVYLDSHRYNSDCCAKEARDHGNDEISNYSLYGYMPVPCKDPQVRVPPCMYDHVNLWGRPGVGLAEDCLVDRYSALRNDPSQLTRDRCRQQLFGRIFHAGPCLKPGVVDPNMEMQILQGTSTSDYEGTTLACKKSIMEQPTYKFAPLLECTKAVAEVENTVEPFPRGGMDTRAYVLRQNMLMECHNAVPGRLAAAPLV